MMDFWEGALIGAYWVQTDYEDSRHSWFHLLVGLFFSVLSVAIYFYRPLQRFFPLSAWAYLILMLIFLVGLPFFAPKYRRRPLVMRLLQLFAYGVMYVLAWSFPMKMVLDRVPAEGADIFTMVGEFGNSIMSSVSSLFGFLGGIAASLTGVILGALVIALIFIAFLFIFFYTPVLYFFLIKHAQRLVDLFVLRRLCPERL